MKRTSRLSHDDGALLLKRHVGGAVVSDIEQGIGTMWTLSFEASTVRLWIEMCAWYLTDHVGYVVGCEDPRDAILAGVERLVGARVTEVVLGPVNDLAVSFGTLTLSSIPIYRDECAWTLFDPAEWFMGAESSGSFSLEVV